jgi:phosphate ABC transporter permease subunit PstA
MSSGAGIATNPGALKRLRRRYREEGRFRFYGVAAIVFAIASLAVLLASIVGESISAFTKHELSMEVRIDPAVVDPSGRRDPAAIGANVSVFSDLMRDQLKARFPEADTDRALRRQLARMVSTLAGQDLAQRAAANPQLIGQTVRVEVPVSDLIDLYLKGLITDERLVEGNTAANISRIGGEVTVRAAGGFASVYDDMADRLREEAEAKNKAAAASQASLERVNARIANLNAGRADLVAADAATIRSAAEDYAAEGDRAHVALVRSAAKAAYVDDPSRLRSLLAEKFSEDAAHAEREADELMARGASYSEKARAAEAAGEPAAETRRIQAQTAWLAGDRRRVDAALLRERSEAVAQLIAFDLLAQVSLATGRPFAPIAELVAADEAGRKGAVTAVSIAETIAADAAVREQEARIARLTSEASALKASAPDRAAALETTALPAAKSRLNRLTREADIRRETYRRLAGLPPGAGFDLAQLATPADPQPTPPSPAEEAAFVAAEREAQLGLDLGGPLAAAAALGEVDAGRPGADAALKALMVAHIDLDIAEARRDIERLTRKRDRDTQLANVALSQVSTAGAPITPDEFSPSILVEINGGVVKAKRVSPDEIAGEELIPTGNVGAAAAGAWRIRELKVAEADRLVTDRQAAWANTLQAEGDIARVINFDLLTKSDSTYPELAGLAAGLMGSFWIMIVTLALSLPVGVAAAIYLEEFAPRNRITDFIEVNINNLAAVPSIVFGLLGAAVFINFFDLPRSAPVVGGLVLSLITLPTIIIATRAALGAVPPSIREGALAVGASLPQTVFHHVLPLASPGILTGAIIGLARALGETAPLLLIGMVAFVADPPDGPMDSATALPVLVYKWSSAAERAWQPMTSAAIIVLLVFMFAMNALAVYLRRRLERRW